MIGDGGQSGFDVARPGVPVPHVLRRQPGGELRQRRHRGLDLDRRPDLRACRDAVLRADHQRPDGQRDDVRRHRPHGRTGRRRSGSATARSRRPTRICNEWTGTFEDGLRRLGGARPDPADRRRLGRPGRRRGRGDRAHHGDNSTAWAATTTGRVFISSNVDAEPAAAVIWTRLDDDARPTRTGSSAASTSTRPTATGPGSPTAGSTRTRRPRRATSSR